MKTPQSHKTNPVEQTKTNMIPIIYKMSQI